MTWYYFLKIILSLGSSVVLKVLNICLYLFVYTSFVYKTIAAKLGI